MNHRIPFFRVEPIFATLVATPFDKPSWVYEEKYDGDRVLAYKEEARVRLLSRNGKDRTLSFPRIAMAIRELPQPHVTLLLDGEVVVVGKVGTGFDHKTLAALYRQFQPLIVKKTALIEPPRERDVTYLRPQLVAQVSYQELTDDRKLRQPVYRGLRDDKSAKEVTLAEASA